MTAILKTASIALGSDRQSEALALVSRLRKNVQSHSFTEGQILSVIFASPETVSWLYGQFAALHRPANGAACPAAAAAPSSTGPVGGSPVGGAAASGALSFEAGLSHLKKTVRSGEEDLAIFTAFHAFNHAILKTNFFRPGIVALSFRLAPTFLSADFPDKPHGIFMVIG